MAAAPAAADHAHQARQREELELERAQAQAGNRRQFDAMVVALHTGARIPPSLLIIDVDKFKSINDDHSHTAGDAVLREIATVIAAHCRAGIDVPIRYAGDEFAVFLNTDLDTAVDIAGRIRAAVAATDVGHLTPPPGSASVPGWRCCVRA